MFRAIVGAALVLSSSVALADEASARKTYDAGERAYNLGQFDRAVELFKQAYEDWPEPAFLFNIAQTYRQAGNCKQALFFYKRFLALKQTDTKKPIKPELQAEVEKRILELEECIRRELASQPPDALDNPRNPTTTTTSPTTTATPANANTQTAQVEEQTDEGEEDESEQPTQPTGQPTLISARFDGGVGMFKAGDIKTTQFAGALIGGYPLALGGKAQLELGAAISFLPVPYTTMSNESGTGMLFGLMANAAPSVELAPKVSARVDVGLGVQIFSGLEKNGNPFTNGGAAATGPLSVFHVRGAVSGDYAVTPNLVLTVTPIAFAYSPAPAGFVSSASSLTTMSFLAGIGYRR